MRCATRPSVACAHAGVNRSTSRWHAATPGDDAVVHSEVPVGEYASSYTARAITDFAPGQPHFTRRYNVDATPESAGASWARASVGGARLHHLVSKGT
eukprot:2550714-Prymnesium_polylepis.2